MQKSTFSHSKESDINIEKWTHVIFFINFHKNEESQTYLTLKDVIFCFTVRLQELYHRT